MNEFYKQRVAEHTAQMYFDVITSDSRYTPFDAFEDAIEYDETSGDYWLNREKAVKELLPTVLDFSFVPMYRDFGFGTFVSMLLEDYETMSEPNKKRVESIVLNWNVLNGYKPTAQEYNKF